MKPDPLKHLRVASPCPTNWEQMTGDERVRFCSLCDLHVYNIAELTRKQATALIAESEGRICGRIYRRSDGTVITRDCPIGLRAIRRRVARAAGAVFATALALSSAVFGQKPAQKDASCKQQVTISRKNSDKEGGVIAGTIFDPNGAVVAGAQLSFTERKSKKAVRAISDDEGNFRSPTLGEGVYEVVLESPGFTNLEINEVSLGAKETVNLNLILMVDSTTSVTVGIIVTEPMIDTSSPGGKTIISGDMIRRLPIP